MPTYNYRCKECQFEFEELQRMTEASLTLCPSCDKEALIRMIGSGAGLMFKGSGYYQTDYKKVGSDSSPAPKPATEPAKTSPETTSSQTKESTPTVATPTVTTSQEKTS